MTAYYNEIDPFAVAWLRELIREGVIADGIVDDRSIEIVEPRDLDGFTQCHFFAGIGVWSYALRRAGWPDDRPVWTGSCPCQPFSAAGKGEGFADPRHLWPAWFRLARVHRPVTVLGEQVSSAIRNHWLDLVSADMEAEGYAVGSVVFGSHSVGAPHQRQRVYFVADRQSGRLSDADSERRTRVDALLRTEDDRRNGPEEVSQVAGRRPAGGLPVAEGEQHNGRGNERGGRGKSSDDGDVSDAVALGDAESRGRGELGPSALARSERHLDGASGDSRSDDVSLVDTVGKGLERHDGYVDHWNEPRRLRTFATGSIAPSGILSGFWGGAEWVECSDGKARPVEPGSFPLANGSPARVGRLRGYGNAINAEAAVAFIQAYREVKGEL